MHGATLVAGGRARGTRVTVRVWPDRKPGSAWREAPQRADQQSGADGQDDGERDLGGDERAARARTPARGSERCPPDFMAPARSTREALRARAPVPNSSPHSDRQDGHEPERGRRRCARPAQNPRRPRSSSACTPASEAQARSTPERAAPAAESATLSVRSWRTMRPRPSAERRAQGHLLLARRRRGPAGGSRRSRTRSAARARPRTAGPAACSRTSRTRSSWSGIAAACGVPARARARGTASRSRPPGGAAPGGPARAWLRPQARDQRHPAEPPVVLGLRRVHAQRDP